MQTLLRQGGQTKAREYMRTFRLPILSPYFQRRDFEEDGHKVCRDNNISTIMIKAFIQRFQGTTASAEVIDSNGTYTGTYGGAITYLETDSDIDIQTKAIAAVTADMASQGAPAPDVVVPLMLGPAAVAAQVAAAIPPAPSSYQTIVSQTGMNAPAISGSLTPMSTYAGSPTFTWARTGAGVYTLTASAAVFSTSGKTGVFVGTLNNLNASCKAVVTSSTVITLTTAIGSLLGLGLLGLTATNTDALLTQTMVYVQTYS